MPEGVFKIDIIIRVDRMLYYNTPDSKYASFFRVK
jgi:hypothetical protein